MAKQLIFVSGFGDNNSGYYHLLPRVWRRSGSEPHVYIFGWDDAAEEYELKFRRFLKFLDSLPVQDELYLVGISAGGTAAIDALAARSQRIDRVVAISSPLHPYDKYTDPSLLIAITKVQEVYALFDDATKAKIVTVSGWYDGVVPTHLTPLPGTQSVRVFGFKHALNIVMATIVARRKLRKLLTL